MILLYLRRRCGIYKLSLILVWERHARQTAAHMKISWISSCESMSLDNSGGRSEIKSLILCLDSGIEAIGRYDG